MSKWQFWSSYLFWLLLETGFCTNRPCCIDVSFSHVNEKVWYAPAVLRFTAVLYFSCCLPGMLSKDATVKVWPTSAQAVWFLLRIGLLSTMSGTDFTHSLMAAMSSCIALLPWYLYLTVKMKKKARGKSYATGKWLGDRRVLCLVPYVAPCDPTSMWPCCIGLLQMPHTRHAGRKPMWLQKCGPKLSRAWSLSCGWLCKDSEKPLGGPGKVVCIDETFICKNETRWVYLGVWNDGVRLALLWRRPHQSFLEESSMHLYLLHCLWCKLHPPAYRHPGGEQAPIWPKLLEHCNSFVFNWLLLLQWPLNVTCWMVLLIGFREFRISLADWKAKPPGTFWYPSSSQQKKRKKWIWRTLTGQGMPEPFSMEWGMLSSWNDIESVFDGFNCLLFVLLLLHVAFQLFVAFNSSGNRPILAPIC